MNRLYVAEPRRRRPARSPTIACPRAPARSRRSRARCTRRSSAVARRPALGDAEIDKWIAAAAKDLQAQRARGVVVAGDQQPPAVHALAHAMNQALGNVGTTVVYTDPVQPSTPSTRPQSLRALVDDMNAGAGGAARDPRRQPGLHRAGRLEVRRGAEEGRHARPPRPLRRRDLGACATGTSRRRTTSKSGATCAAYDGTASIVQPLIAPLYGAGRPTRWSAVFTRAARAHGRTTRCGTTGRRSRRPRVRTSRSSGAGRCTTA